MSHEPLTINNILWATPFAAGPRPLVIALGLQILGIVASGSWHFWYTNLSFRMIGSFTLVSWGTLAFLPDTREHNNGHFEVQARISTDFGGFYCPWVLFGMLGAFTLASWGTLGRSWSDPGTILGHWRTQGRTLRGPGLDFISFLLIGGPVLRFCWVLLDQKIRFFISISRLLFSGDFRV